jgi:EmrB/QacA subfamily drug resistance transporter
LIAVTVVMFAVVMDLLDASVLNVALPSIQTGLKVGTTTIQWLVAGYSLAFAVLLITGGRLGDVLGYRRTFMIGTTGFTLMSLVCGFAPDARVLVIARVLQGGMAALMVPQATSILQIMYGPHERARVMGLLGALAGLTAALGPVIGGLILHADLFGSGWRPIFLLNVPVGLAALAAARLLLPEGRSPKPQRLDLRGTGLVIAGLGLLVLPLIEGPALHWPLWTVLSLVFSVPVLGLLIQDQRAREATLIDPGLFRQRSFVTGLLLSLIVEAVMGGLMFVLTLTLQDGLGQSALETGLATLPMIVGMVLGVAVLAELLIPRMGRYVVTLGSGVLATGLAAMAWAVQRSGDGTHIWQLIPGLIVAGTGLGMLMGPLFAITLQNVDTTQVGSASGVLESVEQLGGVLGVVSIGTVFLHLTGARGFTGAFTWGIGAALALLIVGAVASLTLPRRFRTEEELGLSDSAAAASGPTVQHEEPTRQ